jgi:hypothetical protein
VLLGSCFATHLGHKFGYFQFPSLTNPFGVIFHPLPLAALVERAVHLEYFREEELFESQSLWRNFQAHSSLAQPEKDEALSILNQRLVALWDHLKKANHLILTLGSAFLYRHKPSGRPVANCHAVAASAFEKELTSPDEITVCLENLVENLRKINPDMHLIITVSPVRHVRDGIVENQRSKAHLLTAAHRLVDAQKASYFPSYELLLDELRDYRFYDRDLVHPAAVAVDYIWERFRDSWIDPATYTVIKEVDAIQKGLLHRPLHPDSEAHIKFVHQLETRIQTLQKEFPFMQFNLPR